MIYSARTRRLCELLIKSFLKENGPSNVATISRGTGLIKYNVQMCTKEMAKRFDIHSVGHFRFALGPETAPTAAQTLFNQRRAERISLGAPIKMTNAELEVWRTDPAKAKAMMRTRRKTPGGAPKPPKPPKPSEPTNKVEEKLAKNAATYGRTTVFAPGFEAGLWR